MTSGAAPLRDLMRRLVAAGFLRPAAPELLEAEFMGPLLLWRHLHALGATNPLLTDRQAFVRSHVEQFLLGATPRPRPEQLDRALASMSDIDREVLALRHFEELSNSETAQVLGLTEQAASIRYIRALGRLKNILTAVSGIGSQPK